VEGPLSPEEWRRVVANTSGLTCTVSGTRARNAFDPLFDAHHIVPKSLLRARGLHAFVWDPRNGLFVLGSVHAAHSHVGGDRRIARECLPGSVWEFAAELDALAGTGWASACVERFHPSRGGLAASSRGGI
jgi:hypothetical protein